MILQSNLYYLRFADENGLTHVEVSATTTGFTDALKVALSSLGCGILEGESPTSCY